MGLVQSVRRILALMKKEFLVMWADPGTRKILIIPILVQCIVFGYAVTFNLEHIPYVLLDESQSAQSTQLMMQVDGCGYFEAAKLCESQQCFTQAMDKGIGLIGIHFAPDFATSGEVQVIADARNTASANTALSYLSDLLSGFMAERAASGAAAAQATAAGTAAVAGEGAGRIHYIIRYYYNPQNITRFGILTAMILALSMLQVMLLSSLSVAREKEEGNFDMLLMTPANPLEILVGKALPPAAVAFLQSLALFVICTLYFEIPCRGSVLLLFGIVSVFSVAIVGLGLAISAVARSAQQALVTSFLVTLPCIILSGFITPVSAMPQWFQPVTLINPLYYGVNAVQRVYLEGAGFMDIAHLLIPFALCAAVTMPLSMWLFRHRVS